MKNSLLIFLSVFIFAEMQAQVQQAVYYYNIEVLGKDKNMFNKSGEINVIY